MAVEAKSSGSSMELGVARKLVRSDGTGSLTNNFFDVSQNGDRFLFKENKNGWDATPTPITIVTNWPEAIKKK